MKILQVIPYFTPKRGGDVNVAYNISKQLSQKGHDVTIITTDFEYDELFAKSLDGIKVIPFKCKANFSMMLISPDIKKWLKQNLIKFDIVHLHDFRSYQNIIVNKISNRMDIPYVIHGHGSVARVGKNLLKILYDLIWGHKILRDSSAMIAVSKEELKHFKHMGVDEKKICLIYNGIDIEYYHKYLKDNIRNSFRQKYNLNNKIILYLGRIHQTKGLDFLLQGFYRLEEKLKKNTKIVFVGPNEGYQNKLIRIGKKLQLKDNLKFIGRVDEVDKISAYVDADVFVNPAKYMAGVAITTIEALICQLPVITTTESGEIIQKANAGYVLDYGDVNNLKDKLECALERPDELLILTNNGRKYILQNLSWEKVVGQYIKIYNKILEKKSI